MRFEPRYFGWGVGTLGMSALLNTYSAAAFFFLAVVVGLGPAAAGLLLFVSKIYDGITDPVMGWVSDRTRSRFGRRRPYLIVGALVACAGFLWLFWVPSFAAADQAFGMSLGALLLLATGYTIFNVPYLCMPAEMLDDVHERSRLMSYRVAFISIGTFIGVAGAPGLIEVFRSKFSLDDAAAYGYTAVVVACFVVVSAIACFLGTATARQAKATTKRYGFRAQISTIVGNRPFAMLLGIKFAGLLALAATIGTSFFFVRYVMVQTEGIMFFFGLANTIGMFAGLPLWLAMSRHRNKTFTLAVSATLSAAVSLTWLASGPAEPLWVYTLRGLGGGIASGGMLLMGQALLPDVMEYDYRRTGMRREGIYAGIYSFIEKLAFATAPALVGVYLAASGFDRTVPAEVGQPKSARDAIMVCMVAIPVVLNLLKVALVQGLKLDEKTLKSTGELRSPGNKREAT